MKTQCEEKTVFKFDELSESAKRRAIERAAQYAFDCDWWECTYEDAANIGLEITEFDIQYHASADGKLNWDAMKSAYAVLAQHGESCETYKTAAKFLATAVLMDATANPDGNYVEEDDASALYDQYEKDILQNYADMLKAELKYLESEEVITESIRANDPDFDENGDEI